MEAALRLDGAGAAPAGLVGERSFRSGRRRKAHHQANRSVFSGLSLAIISAVSSRAAEPEP
jgi:hypothetical protein